MYLSVFDKYFLLTYDFLEKKKLLVSGAVVLLTIVSCIGLFFMEFDGRVELMLPDNENIKRNINFFRDSELSNKIVISLALTSDGKSKKDLFQAAEQLEASLTPPLFTETTSGFTGENVMDEVFFSNYISQIITEEELASIDSQMNHDSISERLRGIYKQLLRPESIFMSSMIYSDPLGLKLRILDKLKSLKSFTGYDVDMEDGHFVSRDGRHTMIIAQTPVKMTDGPGVREVVSDLNNKLKGLPDYISSDIIGGHLHTLSNDEVIKNDINLMFIIATIGFFLLFFVMFRDIRAVYIFLIPYFTILAAINLTSFFIGNPSYWVIGLGTVICGIAIDYCVHVYVAVRNHGSDAHVMNDISKPTCIGALTTLVIFLAFFLSSAEGYRQLALLATLSLFFSLFASLFVLPHLLVKKNFHFVNSSKTKEEKDGPLLADKIIVILWVVSVIAAAILSFNIKFDSNIRQLDGSAPEIINAEKNFQEIWGGQDNKAIFVATGKTYEDALRTNDMVYQDAVPAIGAQNFSSLSILWPSGRTREERAKQWEEFWKNGREARLKKLLKEEGEKYQFSESAFSPFFNRLYSGAPVNDNSAGESMPAVIKKHFVQKKAEGYQVLSFFPDEKKYIDIMTELSEKHPGTFIVSGSILSQSISSTTTSEGEYILLVSAGLVILATFLSLKNIKKSFIALVPVITGILWLLGFMSIFDFNLNVANLFAGLIVIGLTTDYGIFMVYNYKRNSRKGIIMSVSIAAVTTLIGGGVLLFARHPALFSSGITLFIGVLAGYIATVFIVPPLERIFRLR